MFISKFTCNDHYIVQIVHSPLFIVSNLDVILDDVRSKIDLPFHLCVISELNHFLKIKKLKIRCTNLWSEIGRGQKFIAVWQVNIASVFRKYVPYIVINLTILTAEQIILSRNRRWITCINILFGWMWVQNKKAWNKMRLELLSRFQLSCSNSPVSTSKELNILKDYFRTNSVASEPRGQRGNVILGRHCRNIG